MGGSRGGGCFGPVVKHSTKGEELKGSTRPMTPSADCTETETSSPIFISLNIEVSSVSLNLTLSRHPLDTLEHIGEWDPQTPIGGKGVGEETYDQKDK